MTANYSHDSKAGKPSRNYCCIFRFVVLSTEGADSRNRQRKSMANIKADRRVGRQTDARYLVRAKLKEHIKMSTTLVCDNNCHVAHAV